MYEPDDDLEPRTTRSSKRRKTSHRGGGGGGGGDDGLSGLPSGLGVSRDDYGVAWICALHIEMAAARAMLDEVYEDLPRRTNDSNTYILGRIGHHNVVVACLPATQYGTNNAASVLTHLTRSFPSIRSGLMVGIGGGVPSMGDIRLGDIVVGTRVMQDDLGKMIKDGKMQRTAIPRLPSQVLGTAVSTLRSRTELEPSQVSSILRRGFENHPEYWRPAASDELFYASYDHMSAMMPDCNACDRSKLVPRPQRASNDPVVHYGGIASGNQVMRDGTTRDDIARELDVKCFEMEAAGLVDILPCLPIRGICDYADSHKNKEWQRYAAAVAAAYAKELLSVLPASGIHSKASQAHGSSNLGHAEQVHRKRFMNKLKFEQMDSRRSNVTTAHPKTCQWFIEHSGYAAWLDPAELPGHHGFLWIKGKPGAGKSTMMKFTYLTMKKQNRHGRIASFFFNARGVYLERSVLGMYRSLLIQLLGAYPDLQRVLDDPEFNPEDEGCSQNINSLKDILRNAISELGGRPFTCFIDALDECDEQQVLDMVQYFEELSEHCTESGHPFRICFSSRHYPYIVVRRGIEIVLELEQGHTRDMERYIASRLRISDADIVEELGPQLLEKASGVFLWLVLVVDILNKEDVNGRFAMKKRLGEIPSDLSTLFKRILLRDGENKQQLLLGIMLILYAARPLRPDEFYHALWSGLLLDGLADDEVPIVRTANSRVIIERSVISSTKGLAESTKTTKPIVQFIHESVRDFLIKEKGLQQLWPEMGFDWEIPGHDRLKRCCMEYMNHYLVRRSVASHPRLKRETLLASYPFLHYASQYALHHANAAAEGLSQDDFLRAFPLSHWISVANSLERFAVRHYTQEADILYILAEKGLPNLIRTRLRNDPRVDVKGERFEFPLFAALAHGNKDAAAVLMGCSPTVLDELDVASGLGNIKDFSGYQGRTPLAWAAQEGRTGLVSLLLGPHSASVNETDEQGQTLCSRAAEMGRDDTIILLIANGADVDARDEGCWTPLLRAVSRGRVNTAGLLLAQGADINAGNEDGHTPLSLALIQRDKSMVQLLLKREPRFDSDLVRQCGVRELLFAMRFGNRVLVEFMLEEGVSVNGVDEHGQTPLIAALEMRHFSLATSLIQRGADVNANADRPRYTPLSVALESGRAWAVQLLLQSGADINGNGVQFLLRALECRNRAGVAALLEHGADPNALVVPGQRALEYAMRYSSEAAAIVLIKHVENICTDYQTGDLLRQALQRKFPIAAKHLISKGADIHYRDNLRKGRFY